MAAADDSVRTQQFQRRLDFVEIDGARSQHLDENLWEDSNIGLEPELQRLPCGHARPDAAQLLSENRLMKPKFPAPELLAAKRVVSKDLLTFFEHFLCVGVDTVVKRFLGRPLSSDGRVRFDALRLGRRAGVGDREEKDDRQDRRCALHGGATTFRGDRLCRARVTHPQEIPAATAPSPKLARDWDPECALDGDAQVSSIPIEPTGSSPVNITDSGEIAA